MHPAVRQFQGGRQVEVPEGVTFDHDYFKDVSPPKTKGKSDK
jgi:hypothetical protein